jgi:hypothetical protein
MPLEAVLTVGWPEKPPEKISATTLHEACAQSEGKAYAEELFHHLIRLRQELPAKQPLIIGGTERLFRRRANGFGKIKTFLGTLNDVVTTYPIDGNVQCHMDVFTYAFLKGAKNIDFFLPESTRCEGPFRRSYPQWQRTIVTLEAFERFGKPLPEKQRVAYLALRRIIARPSARDERRTLATLLVSGPSTSDEITQDLGLSFTLSDRILPTLQQAGVLDRRGAAYSIRCAALPRVVFVLREVMGLDLLAGLEEKGA